MRVKEGRARCRHRIDLAQQNAARWLGMLYWFGRDSAIMWENPLRDTLG